MYFAVSKIVNPPSQEKISLESISITTLYHSSSRDLQRFWLLRFLCSSLSWDLAPASSSSEVSIKTSHLSVAPTFLTISRPFTPMALPVLQAMWSSITWTTQMKRTSTRWSSSTPLSLPWATPFRVPSTLGLRHSKTSSREVSGQMTATQRQHLIYHSMSRWRCLQRLRSRAIAARCMASVESSTRWMLCLMIRVKLRRRGLDSSINLSSLRKTLLLDL